MMAKIGLVAMAACCSFAILVLASLTGLPSASVPSALAQGQIPATYLGLYQRAALTCPGLDWTGRSSPRSGRSSPTTGPAPFPE